MTATYTNLAWPADPYRTGQQLSRKPGPMLTAFTLCQDPAPGAGPEPTVAAAVVYLPLHRTRTVTVSGPETAFGFLAASASEHDELPALARIADLDLARAVRHASVFAGHQLAADLARLQELAGGEVLRGVNGAVWDWAARGTPARGKATMIDCGLDLPATSLGHACRLAQISGGTGWERAAQDHAADHELAAAQAVGRALMIALLAARHLGRIIWQQDLDATEIVTASAWDCFPHLRARQSSATAEHALASSGGPGVA